MSDTASPSSRRWSSLLADLTVRELDELQAAVFERRAEAVFADRKRVRALVIEAAHAEGFALSELFELGGGSQRR
jgi:hypothetical protein